MNQSTATIEQTKPPALIPGATVRYIGPGAFAGAPARIVSLYDDGCSATVRLHVAGRRWSRPTIVPVTHLEAVSQ